MKSLQPLFLCLLAMLAANTAKADDGSTCPSFALSIEGDSCNGDMVALDVAFERIYLAMMNLSYRQEKDGNSANTNTGFNGMCNSNKDTSIQARDYHLDPAMGQTHFSDSTELTVQANDGVYKIFREDVPVDETRRRMEQEEDLSEEFLNAMTKADHGRKLEYDCGLRSWCLNHVPNCCVFCPHHCSRRRRQLQNNGKVRGASDVVHDTVTPCEYLDYQLNVKKRQLPGCLAGATVTCTMHEQE